MGSVYRRTYRHCATCRKRLAKTADRTACTKAGHAIQERKSAIYWIRYARAGKAYNESSESDKKRDAVALLKDREGDVVRGKPVTPQIGKLTFEDAADDLIADYTTNRKKSLGVVRRRVAKHLTPFFRGRRMTNITTTDVRAYILERQTKKSVVVRKARPIAGTKDAIPAVCRPASNAEINRELALLKRMFSLAIQAAKLLYRPHIPMLKEDNVRTGFFEPEQYAAVLAHLPADIKPVIEVAYITGWRTVSEVLPLEWRQVDFAAGEIRLNAGTTKNGEGRVFPMTTALRACLEQRQVERKAVQDQGHLVPWVFWRMVAEGRGGKKKPQPIISFNGAWRTACRAAGCPGRIPHDLRRTAVRNLVRAGIPERVAMMMTGHKTRSVFERYNIVSDGDLREAALKLDVASTAQAGSG